MAFAIARNLVFHSDSSVAKSFLKYLTLVVVMGFVSYSMLSFLYRTTGMPLISCKLIAEGLLFVANFSIQRQLVFARSKSPGSAPSNAATDWDRYYKSVPFTAHLTRRYTESVLLSVMRRFTRAHKAPAAVVEIGGANSCFLDGILRAVQPAAYHVIDSNELGLSLLRERVSGRPDVFLHRQDVLHLEESGLRAGMVFSVGLIEHFDRAGTKQAIRAHFDLLSSGGYALISFPTPTWLYVGARSIAETLGLWRFTDERPLEVSEVREAVREFGEIVFEKTLWPLVFTQRLIVIRKADAVEG